MKASVNHKIEHVILKQVAKALTTKAFLNEGLEEMNDTPEMQLFDFHVPKLPVGKYRLLASQELSTYGNTHQTFKNELSFEVVGPPTRLTPNDIHTFFPPKASIGGFSNVLPHVVIQRSTIPWEKIHYQQKEGTTRLPWLALVVLDDNETQQSHYNAVTQEVMIHKNLIPTLDEVAYLSHVMKRKEGDEQAVLIANRLPKEGVINTIHLIALDQAPKQGVYHSLFTWNFTCENEKKGLAASLSTLNRDLFRLPTSKDENLNACLRQGYVPLPHFVRNGHRLMSWYRSPLAAYLDQTQSLRISHINSTDQLLRYFEKSKRLDVTYAAAWELGKWLTLQKKEVATAIYQWKKQVMVQEKIKQRKKDASEVVSPAHDTVRGLEDTLKELFQQEDAIVPIPLTIIEWLKELILFSNIPFSYLVPDEALLPEESIRFFRVDAGWLWALIDGAMSVGRLAEREKPLPFSVDNFAFSGCIIRSQSIKDYPDLKITAKDQYPITQQQFGDHIKLCLFQGKKPIEQLELFLNTEGMHFGFSTGSEANTYVKHFYPDPMNPSVRSDPSSPIQFKQVEQQRLVDFNSLIQQMPQSNTNKSSAFALQMTEKAPKVVLKVAK